MAGISQVKVVLNDAGIKELLNSEGVQAFLAAKAEQVRAQAAAEGGEFEASVRPGKSRARASVITSDQAAKNASAMDGTLAKAGYSVGGTPGGGG